MSQEEFLYEYSLSYISYMIDRYADENINMSDKEEDEQVYHASDVLR